MRKIVMALVGVLLVMPSAWSQMPEGFRWINIETDKMTMSAVRRSLAGESFTAIREVGTVDGFALVMTASRDDNSPTPDYDLWNIYSITLKTGTWKKLVSGYSVHMLDWYGKPSHKELGLTYYDCWECEGALIFTTLRYQPNTGWLARWVSAANEGSPDKPGVMVSGDGGDDSSGPSDQIFALLSAEDGSFQLGSWEHALNSEAEKIVDNVFRYSIDPKTGKEKTEELKGSAAQPWMRKLCQQTKTFSLPNHGQDSASCKALLRKTGHPAASSVGPHSLLPR